MSDKTRHPVPVFSLYKQANSVLRSAWETIQRIYRSSFDKNLRANNPTFELHDLNLGERKFVSSCFRLGHALISLLDLEYEHPIGVADQAMYHYGPVNQVGRID